MRTRSLPLSLMLALSCPAVSPAQWVQVGSDSGLIYTYVRLYDNVIVSLNTKCANVYSRASVSDSIKACEPAGTVGFVGGGPRGSSDLTFWGVNYADGIAGWTAAIDLTHPIPTICSLAVIDTNLFAGTADGGGAYRSTNNGRSWSSINDGIGLSLSNGKAHIHVLAVSGRDLFAGTDVGTFRSTNNGTTWTQELNQIVFSFVVGRTCLFEDVDGATLRSTNSGTSWEPITCPGTLAIIDTNLFAEHSTGQIDLSTDNGTSWKMVWPPRPSGNAVYFCASGNYLLDIEEGDGTSTFVTRKLWTDGSLVDAGEMNFPPSYPGAGVSGKVCASGTNLILNCGGNFFSTNSGADWSAVSLPPGSSFPIPFVTLGTNVFLGATGLWKRPLSELTTSAFSPSSQVPFAFELQQNYPNPFNPSTTIRYSLPSRSHLTLVVYDVLGERVADLVNTDAAAGDYEVKFDGSALASGVYFYRLQAGSFVQTKKLLLLR